MIYFGQTSAPWGPELLGNNIDPAFTMAAYGCLVTSVANILVATTGNEAFTPQFVNNWFKANGGFPLGSGALYWAKIIAISGGNLTVQPVVSTSLPAVEAFLAATPNFAIVEFDLPSHTHYCLANLQGEIIDSEDGKQKSMATYPFARAHLYTAKTLAGAVASSAPAAANTQQVVPINATVTITVDILNARSWNPVKSPNGPDLSANCPEVAQFSKGAGQTAKVTGWVYGQSVTIGKRTDNVWLRDLNNNFFSQAATTRT